MDCILFHWCVIHHAVIYHPALYLEFYVYIYIYAFYILQCVACWNFMYSYVLCQKWRIKHVQLECGTWYHHPRRLQCVLSRNLIIFKVATWHYRCRHILKINSIWDNLQCYLLVPRSPSKPVMLTFDLQSRKSVVHWDHLLACIT